MKFKFFSVVVGKSACISHCPFCVSCEPITKEELNNKVNWRNFDIACRLAEKSNIDTVMLTSRGEPLLYPDEITQYLKKLSKYNFPFIELQTNGILFSTDKIKGYLKLWYDLGLTHIAISTISHLNEENKNNYMPDGNYPDLSNTIKLLHNVGFSIRLACVCHNPIMNTPEKILDYIEFAKENNVEQVTLRPINDEYRRKSAQEWIEQHKLTDKQKQMYKKTLNDNGTLLLEIDRIGNVYDVNGQNVCLSFPLNMNTRDTDPDNGRQLIFFSDGHIRYEWEKTGGILL